MLAARAADDRPGLRRAEGGRARTWRQTVAECAARAAWLAARPRPADRPVHVGALLDNVPEMVFLLGGAALSGSVLVALNTTRSAVEPAGDAARADCDLLVTEAAHADLAAAVGAATGRPATSTPTRSPPSCAAAPTWAPSGRPGTRGSPGSCPPPRPTRSSSGGWPARAGAPATRCGGGPAGNWSTAG